ncbi:Universal stress protein family protein [Balnearium lithotrophicum]|uniref:Universal stress protein family protein n=1 Tax=Balnearium lithotrophicum TaxID=223788 RepID=A0A521BDY1_9BACT|nr:universal stress protein [Balnearium lithotrophicum]SMO45315.1 Universal stress protein family protein [Balnearium lithotrophicum]
MLFERILYPVDLRRASINVKPYILKLKEAGCIEVHIVYVLIPSDWGILEKEEYDSEDKIEALRGTIDDGYVDALLRTYRKLKDLAKEFEERGIKTRVSLISGELAESLSWYTKEYNIKLVALGITDESLSFFKVGKVLDIIKEIESPILIVKTKEEEGNEEI